MTALPVSPKGKRTHTSPLQIVTSRESSKGHAHDNVEQISTRQNVRMLLSDALSNSNDVRSTPTGLYSDFEYGTSVRNAFEDVDVSRLLDAHPSHESYGPSSRLQKQSNHSRHESKLRSFLRSPGASILALGSCSLVLAGAVFLGMQEPSSDISSEVPELQAVAQ